MKKNRSYKKSGSVFVVVIGILAIIIFAATMFMSSTVQEGRETSMSIRGLQANSLAEASLERAMSMLVEKINQVDPEKANKDDLGIRLRLPATEGGTGYDLSKNFGTDKELNLDEAAKKEIVLTQDDLQANDPDKMLDNLVDYMTGGGHESYEVTVKAKIANAFRISPGNDYPDFKVPGVDIDWNLRFDVNKFLEGNGYTALDIGLPSGLKWLSFSIPIKVGPIKICDINLTSVVGKLIPPVNIGGKEYTIDSFTEFNTLADILINQIICKDADVKPYPLKLSFDKVKIPKNISEMWPSGVAVQEKSGQYLEKYGQIEFECEAKIKFKDKYTAARRIEAVKEFKVADCEPPAPMYSFFVNNLKNKKLYFNNYGGQFIVNSYDYSGLLSKIKNFITNTTATEEKAEENEYPGLIRLNYKAGDGTTANNGPMKCNIGLVGDWGATPIEGDDSSGISRLFTGIESLMLLSPKSSMAVVGGKYNINAEIKQKDTKTNEEVPDKLVDSTANPTSEKANTDSNNNDEQKQTGNYSLEMNNKLSISPEKDPKKWLQGLTGGLLGGSAGMNLFPNVGEMSTNVISLGITLALKPLVSNIPLAKDVVSVPDCFQKWDMPYMGTSNSIYPLPTTGTGTNKTHFFGNSGLHPTMSKEIEGNVMKNYRQWAMCIVGMNPTDRLPLLPFPPVFLPPAPLVVPIWKAGEVLQKYDFNISNLKAHDDAGQAESHANAYDPSKLENMAPNLYTCEQYAKKATYYYDNYQDFIADLPNRTATTDDGHKALILNGITYISGSLGEENQPFTVDNADKTLYVAGKGMIVCSGNIFLGCNIVATNRSDDDRTVFTLMSRKGGLAIPKPNYQLKVEGSVYTDAGIYLVQQSSLHIVGNWVTNTFNKAAMGGTVVVDYVSSRVRTSLGSLHPTRGKYDPKRYHVSFSPTWSSWRAK